MDFTEWKNNRPQYDRFNEDGIVNDDIWIHLAPGKHILYVLKETNNLEGSLTEFLKNGGSDTYFRTWNNVARWTQAIIFGQMKEYVDRSCLHETVNMISVINLKKQAGDQSASKKEIREYAKRDREYILQEIRWVKPDIVITCGFDLVSVCVHDYILDEPSDNWKEDESGIWYYYTDKIKSDGVVPVVSMPHPNRASKKWTTKLLDLYDRRLS